METLGLIVFFICAFIALTTDESDIEDNYKIHKYWQGSDIYDL